MKTICKPFMNTLDLISQNYERTNILAQSFAQTSKLVIFCDVPKLNSLVCQFELALQFMDQTKPHSCSSPSFYSPLNSPSKDSTSLQSSQGSPLSNEEEYTLVVADRPKPQAHSQKPAINSDLRIVEHNLVLATGIMRQLNNQEILYSNCYFARYGPIVKMVISSQHSSFAAINQDIQVFITYENELDAAWTIIALKDTSHHRSFIKIHYGTSRYCSTYINGEECTLKGCYFNHKYRTEHRHKSELKNLVEEQYSRVYRLINENLEYFVRKEYEEFKNKLKIKKPIKCHCYGEAKDIIFPSFKATFEKLIQQGKISSKRYEEVKNKIKLEISKQQKGLFTKKEAQYKEINNDSDRERNSKNNNKNVLDNSFLLNSMRNPSSPTISSENSVNDGSFDQIPPLTDEQQTNRITILKVAQKLMGRQFRQSRFKFVPYLDLKTTLQEERKLQKIISKEIINNC